jgi:hypothetical protein
MKRSRKHNSVHGVLQGSSRQYRVNAIAWQAKAAAGSFDGLALLNRMTVAARKMTPQGSSVAT